MILYFHVQRKSSSDTDKRGQTAGTTSSNVDHHCQRHEKYSMIGYDKGKYIEVDVGACRTGKTEIHGCIPLRSTEERHLLFDAHFVIKVDTIQACQNVTRSCQRRPHTVTFYPGTEYSTTIDAGVCGGPCQKDKMCKPVWNQTESISTPNGLRSIPTIAECACVRSHCYRVSNFEGFPEQYTDAKGNTATRTKLVDMGACISENSCPGRTHRRTHKPNKIAPLEQIFSVSKCTAKTFKNHSFVLSGGRPVNISAIATCSCA